MASESELRSYLDQHKITEILSELVEGLCLNRPEDAIAYMINVLQSKNQTAMSKPIFTPKSPSLSTMGDDEEETDEYKLLRSYNLDVAIRRASIIHPEAFDLTSQTQETAADQVSTETEHDSESEKSYGSPRKSKDSCLDSKTVNAIRRRYSVSHPRRQGFSNETTGDLASATLDSNIPPKSDDEIARLMSTLTSNVMFQHLDDDELDTLVKRGVRSVQYKTGDTIITQGEEGDNFYMVDSGLCEIFVKDDDGNERLVSSVSSGGSFGELALMYGTPRAATIKAASDVKLWAIERVIYRKILMEQTQQKRRMYESFLAKVPILQSLSGYERLTIADALQPQTFENSAIIRQGELGDAFYIIVEGTCEVTRTDDKGQTEVVGTLHASDFFGELALLFNQPRAATVTAVGSVRVVKLDRRSFNRILGPIEDILKRNMETYRNYVSNRL